MADTPLDPKVIQDILNNLNKVSTVMAATMDMLVDKERQFLEIMDRVAERFGGLVVDAKKTVSQTDVLKGEFREVLRVIYDMNRSDFFKGKTLGDVKKRLEEMHRIAMKVSRDPDYGKGNAQAAAKSLEDHRGCSRGNQKKGGGCGGET